MAFIQTQTLTPEHVLAILGVSSIEELSSEEIDRRISEYHAGRSAQRTMLRVFTDLMLRVHDSSLKTYREKKGQ